MEIGKVHGLISELGKKQEITSEENEQRISIRGRTARKMVKVANHFPVLGNKAQNGELRARLSEREKIWVCPEHLEKTDIEMTNFTMELIHNKDQQNKKGIILQLHGGGYYGKMHNTYRDMAALYNEISKGFDVLSVDYRVAPKNPYPAALQDAVEAYKWILDNEYPQGRVFVVGDSAGGGLTLALCLYLRDKGISMPAGIVTMSAWTDLTKSGESYQENFDIDPMFGGSTHTLVYKEGYYKDSDPADPYISPINGDYTGFPPMLLQVGEYEMLLSDTLTVAEKAREAGVTVKEHVYPGMFHVFQMGLTRIPESKEAWVEIGRFIRKVKKE